MRGPSSCRRTAAGTDGPGPRRSRDRPRRPRSPGQRSAPDPRPRARRRSRSRPSAARLLVKERMSELPGVERAQVLEPLAHADQLHRDAELAGDRERDPALRGPVELRQHNAADPDYVTERARLAEAI